MSRTMRLQQKAQGPSRFSFRLTDQSICNQKGDCITSKRLPAFIVTCPVSSADLFGKKSSTNTPVASKRSQNPTRSRLHSESHGDGERQKRGRWKPDFGLG